ncbi:hypothetical protein AJ88_13185 [Mesorhizobium amorphae CCBAU 01583]|nr:hypothetical protein AJ88_13185 [Mesorhizobium amorphae CCBAU 01583]
MHVSSHSPLARRLFDILRAFDCGLARFGVNMLAVLELLGDDVDLLDVLESARPFSGPEADDAARDSARP